MYPKRLILDEARRFGVAVLGLDVNASRCELRGRARAREVPPGTGSGSRSPTCGASTRPRSSGSSPASRTSHCRTSGPGPGCPSRWWSGWCWRAASTRCTGSIPDDTLGRRGRLTTRDLLLAVADLGRGDRVDRRRPARGRRVPVTAATVPNRPTTRTSGPGPRRGPRQAPAPQEIQLPLDLGLLGDGELVATGLPELTTTERVRNELDILGSRRPRARRRGLSAAAAGPRGHVLRRAAPAPQRQ